MLQTKSQVPTATHFKCQGLVKEKARAMRQGDARVRYGRGHESLKRLISIEPPPMPKSRVIGKCQNDFAFRSSRIYCFSDTCSTHFFVRAQVVHAISGPHNGTPGVKVIYRLPRSFSETSRAARYSHPGSVVWAGQGSVGFTPGAGRGSGRAVHMLPGHSMGSGRIHSSVGSRGGRGVPVT